ncbi:hypothetical protein GF314_06930 [bacterium]|nr:hypothetical protein [bacterium]
MATDPSVDRGPDPASPDRRHDHRVRDVAIIVLVTLAIGGIAVMDFTEAYGFWYWLAMIPIFGGVGVLLAWRSHHHDPEHRPLLLRRQLLHWCAAIVGILLTFLMLDAGTIDRSAAGLIALLVLALTTTTAGVHFEWRLAALGIILAVTLAAAVIAEHFFWILLPLAVVAVVLLARRRH